MQLQPNLVSNSVNSLSAIKIEWNKNAFQSKAHLPLTDRKSNTYNLTLEWPWHGMTLTFVWPWCHLWPWPQTSQNELNWCPGSKISIFHEMTLPWPNDLDTQTWPRYCQDVTPYQNEVSVSTALKVIARTDRQTHRHTRTQTDTQTRRKHYLYRIRGR